MCGRMGNQKKRVDAGMGVGVVWMPNQRPENQSKSVSCEECQAFLSFHLHTYSIGEGGEKAWQGWGGVGNL